MAESKKRWLALIMAVVMLAALLPDNFLSAVKVRAENNENTKNIVTIQFSAEENLNSGDFSLTLYELTNTDAEYEENGKELTSVDGWYLLPMTEHEATNTDVSTSQNKNKSKENKIVSSITNNEKSIEFQFEGLSKDSKYVYEFCDSKSNYFTCCGIIDISNEQNFNKVETLQKIGTAEKKINLSVNQNISAEAIDVKYDICPVIKIKSDDTEHVFRKQAEVQSSQGQVATTNGDLVITFSNILYNSYEVDFYTEDNQISKKTVCIDYDSEKGAYKLADSEGDADSITFESNKVDILLQLDFSDNQASSGETNAEIIGTADLYAYDESNGAYNENPVLQKTSVNLVEQVNLGTLDLPFASKYMLKITISDKDSVYKTTQRLDIVLMEENITMPDAGVGNKIYTLSVSEDKLERKKDLSLEFNNNLVKIEEDGKSVIEIQARCVQNMISINEYISSLEEGSSLTCSYMNESSHTGSALKQDSTDKTYKLIIDSYFTGEIGINCKLEKEDCNSVEKPVYVRILYGEIDQKTILPDINNIYSNVGDYIPKIKTTGSGSEFYAIQRQSVENLIAITEENADKNKLTDGIIVLPDNTTGNVVYDIYEINSNIIYHTNLILTADTKSPIVTAKYDENEKPTEYDNQNYYKVRTLHITLDDDLSGEAVKKFYESLPSLISSITCEKIIQNFKLDFQLNDKSYIYYEDAGSKKNICTISQWKEGKCDIFFTQSGIYTINNSIEYTDSCGNKAQIIFSGNDADNFILDNVAPTADCKIQARKYDMEDNIQSVLGSSLTGKIVITCLKENGSTPVYTSLEGISDNLSGIKEVKYLIKHSEIKDLEELQSSPDADWNEPDETGQNKEFCKVKFTDKSESGTYFVYYRISDNAGNIAFLNEFGFVLDNVRPVINFKYENSEHLEETVDNINTHYFNTDSTVIITVTDDNLKITGLADGKFKVNGITVQINEELEEDIEWEYDSASKTASTALELKAEKAEEYLLKVECKDEAEIPAVHQEKIIIDKQAPEISYELPEDKREYDKNTYVFKKTVPVNFKIVEDNFANDKVPITVTVTDKDTQKNLTEAEIQLGNWKNQGNIYENSITLQEAANELKKYDVTVTCTDKAGNTSKHTEAIIIDRKSPEINIRYKGKRMNKDNGYYQERTAYISVKEEYSFKEENFIDAIRAAINSDKKEPDLIKISKVETEENYSATFQVEFLENAEYSINNIDYIDLSENKAEKTTYIGSEGTEEEYPTNFFVDKEDPTAKAQLMIYKIGSTDNTNSLFSESIDIVDENFKRLFHSTFLKNELEKKSQFILNDISDSLTGVDTVEYYLSHEQKDVEGLKKVEWCSSVKNQFQNTFYDEKVELKQEENGKQTLIVSLAEPEESSDYYIYYRITDNAKRITIMNGAGITLDQQDPEISFEYIKESTSISEDNIVENTETIHAFSDNVNIKIIVTEEHFDKNNSSILVEKYSKCDNGINEYTEVLRKSGSDWQQDKGLLSQYISEIKLTEKNLQTEEGRANQYRITVTAADDVGRISTHTEIVRIDREHPEITVEYDDSNRIQDHYYNGKRIANIIVKKTFPSSIDEEKVLKAIKTGISVKNAENQEIQTGKEDFYSISDWDSTTHSYTVTYTNDAIYNFSLSFQDKLGNDSEKDIKFISKRKQETVSEGVKDSYSFVIDSKAPKITVSYKDEAKKADYYHAGNRTATLEIEDLSFAYAYHYNDKTVILEKKENVFLFNEDFINLSIDAKNPFVENQSSLLPIKKKWKYESGKFITSILYEKEAVYTFKISGKDICQKEAVINYKNENGTINDGQSFIIDSTIPVITVTYDDTNKKTGDYADGYYQGTRTSEIEIKDLSLYYAKTTNSLAHKDYPLTKEYVDWKITAKDIQNTDVEQAYQVYDFSKQNWTAYNDSTYYQTGWSYNESSCTFKGQISYNKDAIYEFEINGKDICQNTKEEVETKTAQILYQSKKDGEIKSANDSKSFVIDTQAPIVVVTYDDNENNKLKDENGFIDHYYKDTRTATVTVSDLSFAYAYRKAGIKNPDVITGKPAADTEKDNEKINWAVSAKNEKNEDVQDAYNRPKEWIFSEKTGTYTQEIQFTGEAIYEFALSGSDLCQNEANVKYSTTDGTAATDGNSFVIDKTAPKVVITYDDTNKQTDTKGYYKGERTAEITVTDLSYIYEEQQEKVLGNKEPELTAARRIPIFIDTEDSKSQEVLDAYVNGIWSFDSENGVYKKTITFSKDAIYTFEVLKENDAEGVLKETTADIYGNTATIIYINKSGVEVEDYASFVISRENPKITVIYDNNEENKQADYYYKDTRIAEIIVSDLSYVYEDKANQNLPDKLSVNNSDRISLVIKAENTKEIVEISDKISQEAWSFDSKNGVYRKTITFHGDAIYTMELSGKNIFKRNTDILYQNSSGEKITDGTSFVIDREVPVITVTYDNTNKKTDYYRNHFYAGTRTARIEISDLSYVYEDRQRAQQENFVYITADRVKLDITAVNEFGFHVENAYEESGWNFNQKTGIYTNTITFQNNAVYSYSMQADDIYGNSIKEESEENNIIVTYQTQTADGTTAVTDWNSFVIDTKAPIVTVTYDDRNKGTNTTKPEYTNGYYRDNRTAHITVSDLSFVYADKYMPEHADASLVLNATDNDANTYILPDIRAYSNDMEKNVENAHTMNLESLWSWNEAYNGYQADITFLAEADYTFSITGKDICKNPANVSYSDVADANRFVIDKTAPTISITYNDNTPVRTIDGRGYFARTRTATVVITEGCDTFDSGDALENIVITARDAAGNDVGSDNYTVSGWTESKASANGNATRYTAEITYRGNANYTFAISYTDKTGHTASEINTNESASPYTFTVDSAAPTGTVSVSGFGSWNSLAELVTFDRWSNSTVNITASADDRISSVYSVKYYKTPAVTAMTRQQLLDLNDSLWTEYRAFSIKPDEMFSVYLRIEDRSGNISFISSDGIIVDATAPNEESIAPEITVTPVQPVNNIYNTDVTVDITVTDPIINGSYSGLKNIRYEIQNMGTVTQQGELYAFDYIAGQTLQSQLLQRWNGRITVDRNLNNSNDVRIVVYAQDNSDNTSSAYTSVQIDVTQPLIDISYDNNNGDASFGTETYFNADRTATIRITERNFNADDVQITITNTDGVIPSVSGWSSFAGTGNGDDAVHTATITYSADGDYVFAISYADLAGNINTAANYGNSLAPEQFTIDKTLPLINVTYDNNSVQNDNYYNAVRTATISITEHNFDAGRYTITLAASDDGVEKTAPSIGGWSNNGDIHTASVQFTDDGYYSMNMSYTDMAGNQAVQFTQQTFYVDQTMPRIEVRGIRNNTANNNETIGFEITCTDTNFDVFTPQLSVTKMTDGRNVTENCEINQRKDIKNGQIYTVENLEQDGIYSLTCTARDKAGNIFDKVVYLNDAGQEESSMDASEGISFLNFSVNRRGSVYMLDSYTDEVAKEYYIKEIDEDLIIVETNVDTLDSYIELNGKKLIEGTDYQMEISGGNGEWYVVRYIIHKELFAGEGEYKVVIYSEDNAGNTAYSDIKGTNMSFIIDKTAPVVTVAGIENNGRYQVERQTVTVIPKDDGGKLQKITIEAFDQNGDRIDGFPIVYEGEELVTLLEQNNGELSFELPEGTGMSVRITCEDAAGNEMDVMSFDNIVVSTNRLTIILADRRFIYAVITGALTLTVMIVLLIVWRKHKKKQSRDNSGTEQE